ncbi:hypothetical protein C900_02059 [Fulvivirga imtechensis AK7]|uniref:Uncharacterized protein n=1 Tax=Fulvivirga imtechensis AK7 TaxID=1237149 RepID=L8JY02_9BACT|nr:hypothetical protein C900_02059 [Fulvivirga imtechensis AK7]
MISGFGWYGGLIFMSAGIWNTYGFELSDVYFIPPLNTP